MTGSQVESCRKNALFTNQTNAPVRKLTATGTLYSDFGNSQFFHQERIGSKIKDEVQTEVSITGVKVTHAGASNFYTQPPVADLDYTPPHILSCDTAKPVRKLAKSGTVKFPRLREFVHFHYNKVHIGPIKVAIDSARQVERGSCYGIVVQANGATWVVQRDVASLTLLDRQLHYCVFDRGYSKLRDLEVLSTVSVKEEKDIVAEYLEQFSSLTGNNINCGTVLNFFELNSTGARLIAPNTESAINIPAVAAALVTKAYHAADFDELELKEGDLISVIDKPPASESSWWRGKKELKVGFFPAECVEVINSRKSSIPSSEPLDQQKLPVLRRRDKIITFLRQFFSHRPAISQLKQSGIIKEKVFGTDLGEYLSNSGLLVPKILTCCCDVLERHGLVDGIYRLSGRATQVQKLREDFDTGRHESFSDDDLLDIHIVSTLLKTYFRELPNPLLTYQLYEPLVGCVQLKDERKRLKSLKKHIDTLPPPNYRTAKYLFAHLAKLSVYHKRTSMTSRNLAIVWAPNLIRHDESSDSQNQLSLLHNVSLQANVTDHLISNYDSIFEESSPRHPFSALARKPTIKSLNKRLVSLRTARNRKGNYRSIDDYMLAAQDTHSLEKAASVTEQNGSIASNLSKSQSVSLDSVFTTCARVHLLESASPASSLIVRRSTESNFRNKSRSKSPGVASLGSDSHTSVMSLSSRCPAKVTDHSPILESPSEVAGTYTESSAEIRDSQSVSFHSEVAAVPFKAPTPAPRQPRKVHGYVNTKGDKPVTVKRPPQPLQRGSNSTKRPPVIAQKPVVRPYTVCSFDDANLLAAPHLTAQRQLSAPQNEVTHYAVSNLFAQTIDTAENSKKTPVSSRQLRVSYLNVEPLSHSNANSIISRNDHTENEGHESDDYDNNIESIRNSRVSDYVNTPVLQFPLSPLQHVSNPTSTDHGLIKIVSDDSDVTSSDEE